MVSLHVPLGPGWGHGLAVDWAAVLKLCQIVPEIEASMTAGSSPWVDSPGAGPDLRPNCCLTMGIGAEYLAGVDERQVAGFSCVKRALVV
jgi:hypothetical protein